jgi:hypothetical protein
MQPHAVTVPVVTPVPIECTFWPEEDGWKGACVEFAVAVPGQQFRRSQKIWKMPCKNISALSSVTEAPRLQRSQRRIR